MKPELNDACPLDEGPGCARGHTGCCVVPVDCDETTRPCGKPAVAMARAAHWDGNWWVRRYCAAHAPDHKEMALDKESGMEWVTS